MAILDSLADLDIKGRVLASTVPNSTGSIVTWNSSTNVFGLRTNAEIISDLNLSSNFVPYTGATANVNLGTRSITSTGGFIGNASTATKLATARTINGTSFNGSANIVTSYWGTARNITIGDTTKSVNGSANVSWSLAEIGATTETWTKDNFHKLAKSSAEASSANYYNALGSTIDANNVLGNVSTYTNTFGGVAKNNSHVVSFGLNNLYGFQLVKESGFNSTPLSIRFRNNGNWTEENFAYQSWVTQQTGDLPSLTTTNKNNLVDAINEVSVKASNIQVRNYAFISNLLNNSVVVDENEFGTYVNGSNTQINPVRFSKEGIFKENTSYSLYLRGFNDSGSARIGIRYTDGTTDYLFFPQGYALGDEPITISRVTPAHKTVSYVFGTYGTVGQFYIYDILFVEGSHFPGWIPAPEDQVSDYSQTNPLLLSYIKNKPAIPTSADYITTNTTQTDLSGNKTTNGRWFYENTNTTPITIKRTDDLINSSISFADQNNEGFNVGMFNKDVFAIGNDGALSIEARRWFWVDRTGLTTSKGGFSKIGATNNDMLLGSGGHRPVSDFALAGSLGNYLPLTGGTMGNTATIHWSGADYTTGIIHKHRNVTSGGFALARMSTNTYDKGFGLSTTGDLVFGDWSDIASLSTSWNTIWHSGNLPQTSINNWNTAFGWGDFRVYGLGIRGDHNTDANDSRLWDNGFYALGASSINRPSYITSSYASGILTISENNTRRVQIATGGDKTERLAFRSLTDTIQGDWLEFIHDNNLDSKTSALGFIKSSVLSGYVPTSRTITAGNGLSGGGTLAANRTITLGTPTAIGLSTTNAVTTSSHTHALDTATITAINNGQTAFGWENHSGRYLSNTIADLGYTELFSGDLNTLPNGNYIQAIGSSSTNGASGIGIPRSLISFGSTSSNNSLLQSDILVGTEGFAVRNRSNNNWRTAWHSGNFNPDSYTLNTIVFNTTTVNPTNNYNSLDADTVLNSSRVFYSSGTNAPNTAGFLDTTVYSNGAFQMSQGDQDNFYYRRRFGGTWRPWNQVASREWVTQQGFSTQTLTAGTNVQIVGNVISATDTNTTYTAGTGLSLTGTVFGQTITTNGTGSFVTGITQTTNGFQVNLGTPPNTTYSAGSGLTLSGTTFSLPITYSGTGDYVANIVQNTNGLTVTRSTLPTFTDAITSISRNGVNIPIVSQNVDIPIFSTTGAGLVPARVGSVATKYLREDGAWVTPTNTTYTAGTLAILNTGTSATNQLWSSLILNQWINGKNFTSQNDLVYKWNNSQGHVYTETSDWQTNLAGKNLQGLGNNITYKGEYANLIGFGLVGSGKYQNVIGNFNVNNGVLSNIFGNYNSSNSNLINLIGNFLYTEQQGQSVYGNYNKFEEPENEESLRKIHVFASGKSEYERDNAVEIFADNSTNFRGRAKYDLDTRNEEWFQEENTLVDVRHTGMNHLPYNASSSTPDQYNFLQIVVRTNAESSTTTDVFRNLTDFSNAYNVYGICQGSSAVGVDQNIVHTKGSIKFNDLETAYLFLTVGITKNPYLVVMYEKGSFLDVRYMTISDLISNRRNINYTLILLGNFILGDTAVFEFNQQIL